MFLQASVWVSTTGVSEYSENGVLLLLAQGKGVAEFFPIDTTPYYARGFDEPVACNLNRVYT
jgi:hypothetical protein